MQNLGIKSLGDNISHFLILGVFAPARYGIPIYERYDIEKLGDNFRSLIILKSNLSACNIEVPYYFNGACSLIRELPKSEGFIDDTFDRIPNIIKPKLLKDGNR